MSDLQRVVKMATLLRENAEKIARLEAELQEAERAQLRLEREDLPALMQEIGVSELALDDGTKVELREDVTAAITEARRAAAHAWLRAHDFGGLIKTAVAVEFPAGDEAAEELTSELRGRLNVPVELKESVHAGTLKAFVKEQIANGAPIPFELFGVHALTIAKISKAKGKRK